jgi:hypothetical protein
LIERVFFTGVSENWTQIAKSNCLLIPYYLNMALDTKQNNIREYAQKTADKINSLGCIGLNCNFKEISSLIINVMHENGLLVSVWTVDKIKDMNRMLSLSPDNITSRKPDKLFMIINGRK